uniref:SAM domain-containing protein n=1 Tax=Panagrolaimus sp. ES5 TaxID=591445 RepID=A0AC34F8S5_9BILA
MMLFSASVQTRKTRVMRMIWVFGFFILISINCVFCAEKPKVTRNVEITADDEKLRDPAGYAAIKELHGLMDDDQSGSIDRFESTDFLQEDLKLTGNDRTRRERAFHHDDDSITVDDMWESWFESEERAWDEKTISNWLVHVVKLPQYEKNFIEKRVTGIALPRIAIQNSSYLSTVLGIKNFVHRQKLQLKALDLVLFGFHEIPQSRIKDIAVAVMTIACLVLGYLLTQSHKKSKQQVEALTKQLSEIASMENDLEDSKNKFDKNEVEDLQKKLEQARRELEESGSEGLSYALQPLLRHTYQMEISCINEKKMECMREMKEAKEFVDRMRRNKLGFVNSLKLATGSTAAGTDAVDAKVFSLKQRMEKIKATMEECHIRWVEIESLCGFTITGYEADRASLPKKSVDRKISSFKPHDNFGHYVRGPRTAYEEYINNALNYQRAVSSKYASSSEASSSSDDAEI